MLGKSAFAAEEGTLLLVASIFRWSVIPEGGVSNVDIDGNNTL
jgi:hypothetical protein